MFSPGRGIRGSLGRHGSAGKTMGIPRRGEGPHRLTASPGTPQSSSGMGTGSIGVRPLGDGVRLSFWDEGDGGGGGPTDSGWPESETLLEVAANVGWGGGSRYEGTTATDWHPVRKPSSARLVHRRYGCLPTARCTFVRRCLVAHSAIHGAPFSLRSDSSLSLLSAAAPASLTYFLWLVKGGKARQYA